MVNKTILVQKDDARNLQYYAKYGLQGIRTPSVKTSPRDALVKQYNNTYGPKDHFLSDAPLGYYSYYNTKYFIRECEHGSVVVDPETYVALKKKYPNKTLTWQNTCFNKCFDKVLEYANQKTEEKPTEVEKELTTTKPDLATGMFEEVLKNMIGGVDEIVVAQIKSKVDEEFRAVSEILEQNRVLVIKQGDVENVVKGLKHMKLEDLFTFAANSLPTLLVGPPGTGKSAAAQQVAEGLGVAFEAMSVGMQTSKSDILGYMSATGVYVPTGFRRAFEEGGVFLMDEIDAGNSNVLIVLNTALSNDYCAFPDKMVKRHKDFKFIGTANTYGNGATQQFVGRNQLDAATLDRFAIIEWNIDDKLESALASAFQNGPKWLEVVRSIRTYVEKNVESCIISPRATIKGARLLDAGIQLDDVIHAVLLGQVPTGQHSDITTRVKEAWNRGGGKPSETPARKTISREEVAW